MWNDSPGPFEVQPDSRRSRLQECAQYCRRLARQSDRPEAVRSLAALAAEFEAEAGVATAELDAVDQRVSTGREI
jgi:hypothetical protein